MRHIGALAVVGLLALGVSAAAQNEGRQRNRDRGPREANVFVPMEGVTEGFTVGADSIVRLEPQAAAGSEITPKVTKGDARLVRINSITRVGQDGPIIGVAGQEYEYRVGQSGPVSIEFKITGGPNPGGGQTVTYSFNVE